MIARLNSVNKRIEIKKIKFNQQTLKTRNYPRSITNSRNYAMRDNEHSKYRMNSKKLHTLEHTYKHKYSL